MISRPDLMSNVPVGIPVVKAGGNRILQEFRSEIRTDFEILDFTC